MKITETIGSCLLFLFCCIHFTACEPANEEENLIWDFAPIVLRISVQDAQGNDLLNPLTPGSIAYQGIKAVYKGKTYEKDVLPANMTRDYMAYFSGLQTRISQDGKYFLTFGEFNGDKTFENEEVKIDWNDGTASVITFSSKLTWKSKSDPVFNRKFCLDGKEIDYSKGFVITKVPSGSRPEFEIIDVQHGIELEPDVDADRKEEIIAEIKADMESHSPYAGVQEYTVSLNDKDAGKYAFALTGTGDSPVTAGEFTIKRAETHSFNDINASIADAFRLIPPDDQIYSHIELEIEAESKEHTFNIFIVRPYHFWIYEDLTAYYKEKYPGYNIKEAVRLLRSKPDYTIKQ